MKADATPLLAIFEKKHRLEIPLFQRQYVWDCEHQWEPLWEDICRKFTEYAEGRKDVPVHFLGAMVLDQKQVPTTHVDRRQVIDGQQRLTTFQIFLAAFRDFCKECGVEELARECDGFVLNKGMMSNPDVDRFKVWPTQADREQFKDVVLSGSPQELEQRHPFTKRRYARVCDPRPRMVEAYLFFYTQIRAFAHSTREELKLPEDAIGALLEECFQALKSGLHVVVIDLDPGDDAQVIFETLNARGEPLLPADLVRNYVFLRAGRQGEPQEALYEKYWRKFDDPFWRESLNQGRLSRPRSDLFMQHFLCSQKVTDVPVNHLFVTYKHWIEKDRPFLTVEDELANLARQRDDFRRLLEPAKSDPLYRLATFLNAFEIGTVFPVLLFLLNAGISDCEWKQIACLLESYFLRRSICSLSTKAYNKVALGIIRLLNRDGISAAVLRKHLSELKGESMEWPNDDVFASCWMSRNAYALNNAKLVFILERLNESYVSSKQECIVIDNPLTVEHLLPQEWRTSWPLEPLEEAEHRRDSLLQTFGNLTLLTQPLNSSVSNRPWKEKRLEILKSSLLPINLPLLEANDWDEEAIGNRGQELLTRALTIWHIPASSAGVSSTRSSS